ncbi:GNAT family N-acetyltransferase [Halorubraceae archaeon YAN]|nr:GNAT family N-acetyltransferase [Halorubraceae archaeon YAN]
MDPSDVTFREATVSDADRLAEIYHSAYTEIVELGYETGAYDVTAAEMCEWLETAEVMLVAECEGTIVGACKIQTKSYWDVLELCRLAVHDSYKGNGIGSALLAEGEQWIKDAGWDRFRIRSYTGHPYLLEMYEKRGYEVVDVYELEDHDYDVPTLEKTL